MLGATGARTRSLIGRATLKECLCASDTRLAVASTGRARRCYLVAAAAACDVIRSLVARLLTQHPDAFVAIPGDLSDASPSLRSAGTVFNAFLLNE